MPPGPSFRERGGAPGAEPPLGVWDRAPLGRPRRHLPPLDRGDRGPRVVRGARAVGQPGRGDSPGPGSRRVGRDGLETTGRIFQIGKFTTVYRTDTETGFLTWSPDGYLRALQTSDVENPSALARLRAQMLRRVQIVTGQGRVNDLLIMEFVIN